MIRRPLALLVVSLLTSVSGAQARSQSPAYLALKVTGAGASVTLTPPGALDHRTADGHAVFSFEAATIVTLRVSISDPATSFARWLGACTDTTPTCTLTVNGSLSVTARLSPVRLYIGPTEHQGTVGISPTGSSCGPYCTSFPYGTRVHLDARACCGYSFSSWSGTCSNVRNSGCDVSLWDTVETTPIFRNCGADGCVGVALQPLSRDVKATVDVRGSGRVQINGSNCTGVCRFSFTRTQVIVLRATGQGSQFVSWSGACSGSNPRCQFSAFNDANGKPPTVVATFGP
jgi:hypothetical protein